MAQHGINKASSFEAGRARLIALAYRMLGSRAEAEDVVQDVWLKWHLADTQEVQTPAAWLTTLTARAAIDRLRHLQRERASQATAWLPEPWLDEMAPSAEELALRASEMSYGVMLLLERLKPDERAAFVLHEAFECDYAEIAKILQRTPAACRQIVHRARSRLQKADTPMKRPDPAVHARVVERLRAALESQDRAGLLQLFGSAAEVLSDAPELASVVARTSASVAAAGNRPSRTDEQVSETAAWAESVTSIAQQANAAERVLVEGVPCVALLREGELFAVIDVATQTSANGELEIVALHVVTHGAHLQTANRLLGRAAVRQLLAQIQRRPVPSIAVGRHFPVDVHT